jgi:hypothetical protein
MRALVACLGLVSVLSWAQAPTAPPKAGACADCGTVRSVSVVEKQQRSASDAGKASGLVATVPLGGGKMEVGSSTKLGRDAVVTERHWNVVVQMDDGRSRVVTVDEQGDWQQGDRVRVEGTRLNRLASAPVATQVPSPTPAPAPRK